MDGSVTNPDRLPFTSTREYTILTLRYFPSNKSTVVSAMMLTVSPTNNVIHMHAHKQKTSPSIHDCVLTLIAWAQKSISRQDTLTQAKQHTRCPIHQVVLVVSISPTEACTQLIAKIKWQNIQEASTNQQKIHHIIHLSILPGVLDV